MMIIVNDGAPYSPSLISCYLIACSSCSTETSLIYHSGDGSCPFISEEFKVIDGKLYKLVGEDI